jgi:tRNA pseudouridine38-40 synthase
MQRYKLTLAYDGSGFHGWQKQHPPGGRPLRTVQQVVEDALTRLLRQPVTVVGASRTDAGVHAQGQVAQFDADTPIPVERMLKALRGRLPDDVDALALQTAPPTFRAINDVTTKQYRYRIWNDPAKPLGYRHLLYHGFVSLDVPRMQEAAARLVGTHDFAGFTAAHHGRESTVRAIHRCEVSRDDTEPSIITITVEGNGFLYNMVRIIAGTLFEVGRGRFDPERVDEVLRTGDRRLAGPTLGPEGLCLQWIKYD